MTKSCFSASKMDQRVVKKRTIHMQGCFLELTRSGAKPRPSGTEARVCASAESTPNFFWGSLLFCLGHYCLNLISFYCIVWAFYTLPPIWLGMFKTTAPETLTSAGERRILHLWFQYFIAAVLLYSVLTFLFDCRNVLHCVLYKSKNSSLVTIDWISWCAYLLERNKNVIKKNPRTVTVCLMWCNVTC